jgi:DNA-binding XRE family transcriptional regulator
MMLDLAHARAVRSRGSRLGLEEASSGPQAEVAPILTCTFDVASDSFRIVHTDLTAADLRRDELAGADALGVVAWSVDEFRRGVEVVFEDGSVTSFSAEYPWYLHDEAFRARVDARNQRDDLAGRVARRVREAREGHGWSVTELARRAGMAAPNVHRVESGKHVPSTATVLRLAEALAVPLQRLVGVDDAS